MTESSTPANPEQYLEVAVTAAQAARDVLLKYFGTNIEYENKDHHAQVVSIADQEAEQSIIETIRHAFPDHNVVGEEGSNQQVDSDKTWVIDPLDGTILFQHSRIYFGILIALVDQQGPLVATVLQPMPGHNELLYTATRGQGATCNGHIIHTSQVADIASACISATYQPPNDKKGTKLVPAIIQAGFQYPFIDACASQALSHVANGQLEGLLSFSLKPWDIAAPSLIVEEAGGTVTDVKGNPINWNNLSPEHSHSIIASNGQEGIHQKMINIAT